MRRDMCTQVLHASLLNYTHADSDAKDIKPDNILVAYGWVLTQRDSAKFYWATLGAHKRSHQTLTLSKDP